MNIDDIKKEYEPIDGKWYIVKELGKGAYGTVYEVKRKDFGNMRSAMKIISVPNSPSEVSSFRSENFDMDDNSITSYFYGFVEEFVKEFQLMAQLRGHSNIVSYEDHDIIKHKHGIGWDIFIRMELLTPVNDFFAKTPPTRKEVIKLGIDVCKALEICQQYQIIHRDIKPSNIFISGTGEYKLGDFGVARTLEKTSSGLSKKGTYTYMAPEVFKGESYGPSVDMYSLGIVMYRLLNNNMEPFRTERTYTDSEQALAKRIKGERITDIPGIDKPLSDIIVKACSYAPQERWQSPGEMRRALESLVDSDTAEILEPIPERAFDPQDDPGSCKTAGLFSQSPEDEAEERTTGLFPQTPEDEFEERTTSIFPQSSEDETDERTTVLFPQSPEDEAEERTIGLFSQNPAETEEQTSGMFSQDLTGKEEHTTGKNAKKTNEYQNVDLGTVQKTDRNVRKHRTSTDAPNSSFIKLLFFKGGIGKREKFLSCVFWLSLLQIIAYIIPYRVLPSPVSYIKYIMLYAERFNYTGIARTLLIQTFIPQAILMLIVFLTFRKKKRGSIICIYILNLAFSIYSFRRLRMDTIDDLRIVGFIMKVVTPGKVVEAVALLSKFTLCILFFKSIFKGEKEQV